MIWLIRQDNYFRQIQVLWDISIVILQMVNGMHFMDQSHLGYTAGLTLLRTVSEQ